MRNCDARLTGEVHKRFYEQRRNWSVLPKPHLVIAAVAVCVAMYLGTAPTLRAVPQQNASGSNFRPGFTCVRYHSKAGARNAQ